MTAISIPFRIAENGRVASTTDLEEAIKQRIIDVLVTTKGERVMRPIYGASSSDLLFEPMDDLLHGEFKVDALNELNLNVSGVTIQNLFVEPATPYLTDDFLTTLNVSVQYKIGLSNSSLFSFTIGDPGTLTEESFQ
jgi:phage baseplate assembly protein W